MRPEKAKQIINLAFKRFSKSQSLVPFCNRYVKDSVEKMIRVNAREDIKFLGREQSDIYPKITEDADIVRTFRYIFDRWNCTGRLKFMRRVINGVQS